MRRLRHLGRYGRVPDAPNCLSYMSPTTLWRQMFKEVEVTCECPFGGVKHAWHGEGGRCESRVYVRGTQFYERRDGPVDQCLWVLYSKVLLFALSVHIQRCARDPTGAWIHVGGVLERRLPRWVVA